MGVVFETLEWAMGWESDYESRFYNGPDYGF
jgi:hypothetical protein